jgi:phage I-like protein
MPNGWFIDGSIAASLIAAAEAKQTPYVIDYEHQTLRSAKNGLPAPASGWFGKAGMARGEGLFAVDVEWTDAAAAAIAAG